MSAKLTRTVALQPGLRISIVDILESRDLERFHSIEKSNPQYEVSSIVYQKKSCDSFLPKNKTAGNSTSPKQIIFL